MENSQLDDLSLLEQTKAGDTQAFRSLVERYQDRLYNLIYRIVGHADDADNVLQETFFKAYKALAGFKQESKFSTWIYRIALNQAMSFCRQRKTVKHQVPLSLDSMAGQTRPQLADKTLTPVDELMADERQMLIQQAICELEPELNRLVVLKDVEGFSYEEIAELLECPVGTVKSRLFKARELLRTRLKRILS